MTLIKIVSLFYWRSLCCIYLSSRQEMTLLQGNMGRGNFFDKNLFLESNPPYLQNLNMLGKLAYKLRECIFSLFEDSNLLLFEFGQILKLPARCFILNVPLSFSKAKTQVKILFSKIWEVFENLLLSETANKFLHQNQDLQYLLM